MLETAMWGPQEWVRRQGSERGANPESLQAPSSQESVVTGQHSRRTEKVPEKEHEQGSLERSGAAGRREWS